MASLENAMHCWSLMLLLDYENDFIKDRMLELSPIAMRLELKKGTNNCRIINDGSIALTQCSILVIPQHQNTMLTEKK